MLRRLTLGLAIALMSSPVLSAAASIPSQATDRLPWAHLVSAATNALCTYLGVGCS